MRSVTAPGHHRARARTWAVLGCLTFAWAPTWAQDAGTPGGESASAVMQRALATQSVLRPDVPPDLLREVVEGLGITDYGGMSPLSVSSTLDRALGRYLEINGTFRTDPVQEGTIVSLFHMAGERAVPFLAPKLLDPSPRVRAVAGGLLVASTGSVGEGDERAREVERAVQLPLCLMATYDTDPEVRRLAASRLGSVGAPYVWAKRSLPERIAGELARLCADPEDLIAYPAAKHLHDFGRDDLIPAHLMQRLREDPEVHTEW